MNGQSSALGFANDATAAVTSAARSFRAAFVLALLRALAAMLLYVCCAVSTSAAVRAEYATAAQTPAAASKHPTRMLRRRTVRDVRTLEKQIDADEATEALEDDPRRAVRFDLSACRGRLLSVQILDLAVWLPAPFLQDDVERYGDGACGGGFVASEGIGAAVDGATMALLWGGNDPSLALHSESGSVVAFLVSLFLYCF